MAAIAGGLITRARVQQSVNALKAAASGDAAYPAALVERMRALQCRFSDVTDSPYGYRMEVSVLVAGRWDRDPAAIDAATDAAVANARDVIRDVLRHAALELPDERIVIHTWAYE
jgi:hypothetical protein